MALADVSAALYWMRWITHVCAPVFTLLAGVSAGLGARDDDGTAPWQWHLIVRGLVLIVLEFTVVHWAWTFGSNWPMHYAQVIWGIGVAMVTLGVLQRVPRAARVALGVCLVAGHNLLDGWHPSTPEVLRWGWAILHDRQVLPLWGEHVVRTSYPVLPMIGLVLAGDGVGAWMARTASATRQRTLVRAGLLLLVLFVVLRVTNVYGDPHDAVYGSSVIGNVMAMLNATKYPMSLAFVLMTLGPAALLFAWWDAHRPRWTVPLIVMGQVPMFLYVAHLYLLHVLAVIWAVAAGFAWQTFDFRARIHGLPAAFGFPLWQTLPFALVTLLLLYPMAVWYARLRQSRRYAITRYL
jgi:uncharacterized membrane protein